MAPGCQVQRCGGIVRDQMHDGARRCIGDAGTQMQQQDHTEHAGPIDAPEVGCPHALHRLFCAVEETAVVSSPTARPTWWDFPATLHLAASHSIPLGQSAVPTGGHVSRSFAEPMQGAPEVPVLRDTQCRLEGFAQSPDRSAGELPAPARSPTVPVETVAGPDLDAGKRGQDRRRCAGDQRRRHLLRTPNPTPRLTKDTEAPVWARTASPGGRWHPAPAGRGTAARLLSSLTVGAPAALPEEGGISS